MSERSSDKAEVNITVGQNKIELVGSEQFISDELSDILEKVNIQKGVKNSSEDSEIPTEPDNSESNSSNDELDNSVNKSNSDLEVVAESLGVDIGKIRQYFYIENDELHIENPLNIEPKYALLGYLSIENERQNKTTFDNLGMKDTLITKEGVDIDSWGDFIYNSRRRGEIRDDPDSEQSRNKPFRLTRAGREEFIHWINEDN